MLYRVYEFHYNKEVCYNIETQHNKIRLSEISRLFQILYAGQPMRYDKPFYRRVVEYGTKLNFESPWSMNMKAILSNSGVHTINRIERTFRIPKHRWNEDILDSVLETIYDNPVISFEDGEKMKLTYTVDTNNIQYHNDQFSLGMDKDDINYYTNLYRNIIKRNPTNVELFDLSQSNSEHSRHWFFNGGLKFNENSQTIDDTLFKMVKSTQNHDTNSIIAFSDNSSAIKGHIVDILFPVNFEYRLNSVIQHIVLTAETHNFPTGIAPFPGAATGIGGRIRDNQCIGRGGKIVAGSAGYCVGNLFLDNYKLQWEKDEYKYYQKHANVPARKILIEASNGASDYGNKIGEPIVLGFARSFGMTTPEKDHIEWLKPIMFTGGIGHLDDAHKCKNSPTEGMYIIRLGGPAYRIGVGGGAASSRIHDSKNKNQDMTAVQRGDPEMENKLNKVIRACIELGDKNPIESIHDQGAGGLGNVVKEIVNPAGGWVNIRNTTQGTSKMSALDIWTSEFQETNTCLINKDNLGIIRQICDREHLPYDLLGVVTGTGRICVHDPAQKEGKKVVDLDLRHILSEIPQKEYVLTKKLNDNLPLLINTSIDLETHVKSVFKLISVGSKQFLTNKVDRSVSGLIAQQQCIGVKQLPLSDYAVIAQSYYDNKGAVTAIGEQPIKGILDPRSMAHSAICELLTNMMWVKIPSIRNIKCSGNWMWPLKQEGEKYALYEACDAMCDMMKKLGISIDGGKDSLSMSTKIDDEYVKSPRSLVLSGYADCDDISNRVTAEFKHEGSNIILIDLGRGKNRMGGSAFAQVNGQFGCNPPVLDNKDITDVGKLFEIIQTCVDNKYILSGHDRSDGGLITTLIEMCLPTNFGCIIDLSSIILHDSHMDSVNTLFNEEPGIVIEVSDSYLSCVMNLLSGFNTDIIGRVGNTLDSNFVIKNSDSLIFNVPMATLLQYWQSTSFELEKLQCNLDCVMSEERYFERGDIPNYKIKNNNIDNSIDICNTNKRFSIAIIREEGSNGDREMAAAFDHAGFKVLDVMTGDLVTNPHLLDDCNGIAFVGGFSFADVLGAGRGWYNVIKWNKNIQDAFDRFYLRNDTFSLGICNGCQLMSQFSAFDGVTIKENDSGRFESRFSTIKINNTNSIMLKGMEGEQLGVWVAHKEGKFTDIGDQNIALQYVDSKGDETHEYPTNPNGSISGIAGLCDTSGRHLIMMPHPERCFLNWQVPYVPSEWRHNKYYPWMKMFKNAYTWTSTVLSADSTI